jgi:hypothetical protein
MAFLPAALSWPQRLDPVMMARVARADPLLALLGCDDSGSDARKVIRKGVAVRTRPIVLGDYAHRQTPDALGRRAAEALERAGLVAS